MALFKYKRIEITKITVHEERLKYRTFETNANRIIFRNKQRNIQ